MRFWRTEGWSDRVFQASFLQGQETDQAGSISGAFSKCCWQFLRKSRIGWLERLPIVWDRWYPVKSSLHKWAGGTVWDPDKSGRAAGSGACFVYVRSAQRYDRRYTLCALQIQWTSCSKGHDRLVSTAERVKPGVCHGSRLSCSWTDRRNWKQRTQLHYALSHRISAFHEASGTGQHVWAQVCKAEALPEAPRIENSTF